LGLEEVREYRRSGKKIREEKRRGRRGV